MDHNNLSIKAILMKYRSPFVASLFQKRPPCFPERCLLFDSQRVNENARVIRSSLPQYRDELVTHDALRVAVQPPLRIFQIF